MRAIGVQRVGDILEVDYRQTGGDKPTRKLLARDDSVARNDGTVMYEGMARNDNTISLIQKAIDTVSRSAHLSGIIESRLTFEEHYFRYWEKRAHRGDYAPEDICGEMEPLYVELAMWQTTSPCVTLNGDFFRCWDQILGKYVLFLMLYGSI